MKYLLVCRIVLYVPVLGWKKLMYRVISSCTKFYWFYFTIESYSSLMAILLTKYICLGFIEFMLEFMFRLLWLDCDLK